MSLAAKVEDFSKKFSEDKRYWIAGGIGVLLVVLLVWAIWPDGGKPPDLCEGRTYRPGQIIHELDPRTYQRIAKLVDADCKVGANPATPSEISAGEARQGEWDAYARKVARAESPVRAESSWWVIALNLAAGPVGTFIAVVFGLWAILLFIALTIFLISFLVVAAVGLRHAPLLVIAAPVMFWWKVLIEIPKGFALQLIDVALSKAEAGKVEAMAWNGLLQLFGLGKMTSGDPSADLGSAAFATTAHVEAKNIAGRGRAPIAAGLSEGQPLTWHTDKHVLILAGTREGKGRDIIIPNLLSYPGSVFVIDPKAENFAKTHRYRATHGAVRVLDPWGKTGLKPEARVRFNPLSLLSRDDPESVDTADVLAHGLVLSTNEESHWTESARALWKMLLLHIASDEKFEGPRDLITARQFLLAGFLPLKKEPKDKKDKDGEEVPLEPRTLELMQLNMAFDGIISDFASSLLDTPEEERGSIISSASRQTDFLDTPALRAALAAEGEGKLIDFSEWRRGVMSCYVCVPADKLEGSALRWIRMIVSAAINEMTSKEEPPDLPVQFILDELASLKRLEQVERAVGLAAGYGVQIWSVWQDIAQMKDLYHSRWASFIGNAGVRYVFGVGDYDTAKYFSDYLGNATRTVTSQQTDGLGFRLSGQSRSLQTRPLMTPDEIMVMERREMLVLLDKMRPLRVARKGWDENPVFKARSETGKG